MTDDTAIEIIKENFRRLIASVMEGKKLSLSTSVFHGAIYDEHHHLDDHSKLRIIKLIEV